MVKAPCCEEMGLKKGPWTAEEDSILIAHIERFGHLNWRALPKRAGLLRCGKSCRLRWTNYLRPDIKRGSFTAEEEETILKLHESIGNRWSAIAARLPGRTDNEIKNVWHTHLKKRRRDSNPMNATPVHENLESAPSSASKQYCTSDFPSSTDSCTAENFTAWIKDDDHQIQQVDQDLWLEAEITGRMPEHSPASTLVGPHLQIPLYCSYNDDNMDFWLNLFMQAAGEGPEF